MVEFLAENPVDAMLKASNLPVKGTWWHLATTDNEYVVKAESQVAAICIVYKSSSSKVLFAYKEL